MQNDSSDSAAWIKPTLPSLSQSYGVSKAASATLDTFSYNKIYSPHLFLFRRLLRVITERNLQEVNNSGGAGIFIGDGATFEVEKNTISDRSKKTIWAAVKRAKITVPKHFTAEPKWNDEIYRRLKAVLIEVEVLSQNKIRQHPNIAPLIGYSWDETSLGYAPVLFMELAPFGDARRFFSSTQLTDEERIALCQDVASGLEALHKNSITHGDVKLENILIYNGDSTRFIAKISDFERSPQAEDQYLYRGTKAYNAPEVQNAHASSQAALIPCTQLWLCDVFSFGLLTLEVLSNAHWYGKLEGGNVLAQQIQCGFMADSDITLQVGLEVAEKSLKPSPALLRICSEILQHTLPKIPRRLCGGWNSIQYILKQNKEDINDKTNKVNDYTATPLVTLSKTGNSEQYSILEFFGESNFSEISLARSMSAELEWTATYNTQLGRRGKSAFELFVMYAVGEYSLDISLQDALHYVTISALSGYSPAFVVGKRLFLANDLPVPEIFQQGPQNIDLYQQIQFLEGLPNEKFYASAVQIFWSADIRPGLISRFCQTCDDWLAMDFVKWLEAKHHEMGSVDFEKYVAENFLLHQAVASGNPRAVDFLLDHNCDINIQTPDGITALHLACRLGYAQFIYRLLRNGADASLHASDDTGPLYWLVLLDENYINPVAEALVLAGAVVNPLHHPQAIYFDDLGLVLWGTPLTWACQCRNREAIESLLKLGADPFQFSNGKGYPHLTHLSIALERVCPESTEILLAHRDFYLKLGPKEIGRIFSCIGVHPIRSSYFNIGFSNSLQRWVMHGSSYNCAYHGVTEVLIRYNLHLSKSEPDDNYISPFIRATLSNNLNLMKELIRLGADINGRGFNHSPMSFNALQVALWQGYRGSPQKLYKTVEFLLQHGAIVDAAQGPAIRHACQGAVSPGIIRLLATTNPSEIDKKRGGENALLYVSMSNDDDALSIVQALVESGANVGIEGDHRNLVFGCCRTALANSLFNLNWPVAKYLLDQGSPTKFGTTGKHKQSVLHLLIFKAFLLEARSRPRELNSLDTIFRCVLDHPVARQENLLFTLNVDNMNPLRLIIFFGLPRLLDILLDSCYGLCFNKGNTVAVMISMAEFLLESVTPDIIRDTAANSVAPFVVSDDIDVDININGHESCFNVGGELVPRVRVSTYRKRIEKIKAILESRQPSGEARGRIYRIY